MGFESPSSPNSPFPFFSPTILALESVSTGTSIQRGLESDFHIIAGVFQLGFEHCEKHRVRIQTLLVQ